MSRSTLPTSRPSLAAGIIGATGSTGVELARILEAHPAFDLRFGTSRDLAGHCLTEIDPAAPRLELSAPEEVDPAAVDVVFICLPHGASAPIVAATLERGAPAVVELSGDLRLRDASTHDRVYGSERSQALADEAVYGLPELNREHLAGAHLVANPGCYATAVALALLPLADEGRLEGHVYVDAKSGVSGAGRAATATTHFCSAHDDVRPYKVGRSHRHVPEMEQTLRAAAGGGRCKLVFVPHLVPLERGMLATCAVYGSGLDESAAHELYRGRYRDEPFVEVLDAGGHARIRAVAHSNRAVISLHSVEEDDLLIVACAIDNLGKGAAGQAVQNANLLVGRPETEGLRA
jgi:N-acetyl-gamma-glutamyl-phosphate reductase